MSVDYIYSRTCKECGKKIHAGYEDHVGISPKWWKCPKCFMPMPLK